MSITIYLNGKREKIENNMSILKLLEVKKIRPEVVTVELNDEIIGKDKYNTTVLRSNDRLEFVYYMGGGSPFSERVADNVLELVGQTPLVRLNKITRQDSAQILAKLESFNPGGSVKDRISLSMIEDAEKRGLLKPGSTIIEPTSGNTGIGLAMVSAVKGYRCILTMPETMSLERIYILKSFGAEIVLTPGTEGMIGSIRKAEELLKRIPNSFIPQQFKNEANPKIHRQTTAKEILKVTNGKIDAFVAGVGTGGTITGVGEVLKKKNPKVKVVAVEPRKSAVLSGKEPGPFRTSRRLAKEEGLFVGISAGAAVWTALKVAKDLGRGKILVVILPDTGERYFSMEQYFEA